jgi:hypothetical protein
MLNNMKKEMNKGIERIVPRIQQLHCWKVKLDLIP